MKPIRDFIGQELRWVHPHLFSRTEELRVGDEVLASINWKGSFSHNAIVETAEDQWEFKRIGAFGSTIAAFLPGNETPIATIKRKMSGKGTLDFSDGRQYWWKSTSFWKGTWSWLTNEDIALLRINRKQVTIEAAATGLQELSLLVLLGFYLVKLSEEEKATTVATVF